MSHFTLELLGLIDASTPVTVAEFKAHQRIQHTAEDALIERYLQAATEFCENESEHRLRLSRWALYTDRWCNSEGLDYLLLPWAPIRAIEGVRYIDSSLTWHWLDPGHYRATAAGTSGRIRYHPGHLPALPDHQGLDQVAVEFVAGYGAYGGLSGYPYAYPMVFNGQAAVVGAIPHSFRQAIQFLAGWYYEHREAAVVGTINAEAALTTRDILHQQRLINV